MTEALSLKEGLRAICDEVKGDLEGRHWVGYNPPLNILLILDMYDSLYRRFSNNAVFSASPESGDIRRGVNFISRGQLVSSMHLPDFSVAVLHLILLFKVDTLSF